MRPEARTKLGYSQQELAERSELSPGHMNALEQRRKWVSSDMLQRLADALTMEPFMLLLPEGYEDHIEAFFLVTEYSAAARKRTSAAMDDLLHEMLAKKR